jgi:parallel beta-helix repeat protein
VRGLRFSSPGPHGEGRLGSGAILEVAGAGAVIEDCVLAGGPANGLVVSGASEVELRASLITGVWAEGVVVNSPAKTLITGCDIRNLYHYGVQIRAGAEATVESCRISGTGWHAVRYDSASPTIRGNLLFENERFGIYASGETSATVTGNQFHGNGMAGMACWNGSSDLVENNTFSRNGRAGLEILDVSNPRVRHNIFFDSPIGISNSNVKEESPWGSLDGGFVLEQNQFWQVGKALRLFQKGQAAEDALTFTGSFKFDPLAFNVTADPLFVNLGARDFTLAARSAARLENVGALDPLAFESPWPTQPEEAPFIQQRTKAAVEASAPSRSTAYNIAKPWIDEVLQIEDAGLRAAGVEKIRAALASADEASELLLELFESSDPSVLRELCRGLWGARVSSALEARLIELARTEDRSLYHDVIYFALSTLEGKSAAVVDELFRAAQDRDHNNWGRALWGLSFGVPREHQGKVADFALKFFAARGSEGARDKAVRLIEAYAEPRHAAQVEALAQNELVGEPHRARLRGLAEVLRAKE